MKYIVIALFAFVICFGAESQAQSRTTHRRHRTPAAVQRSAEPSPDCRTVVDQWRARTHNGLACVDNSDLVATLRRCHDARVVTALWGCRLPRSINSILPLPRPHLAPAPEPYAMPWYWDYTSPTPILVHVRGHSHMMGVPIYRLDAPPPIDQPQTGTTWTGLASLLLFLCLIVVVLPLALFRVMQLKHENWSLKQRLTEAEFRQDDLGPFRR